MNADLATLTDTDASASPDTIELSAVDSLGYIAAPAAIDVSVTGLPVISAPSSTTIALGVPDTFIGVSLSENGALADETFTVTVSDTSGDLTATGTGVSSASAHSLTISGSLAQVNADLATLTDTDASASPDTIELSAVDSLGYIAAPAAIDVSVTGLTPVISAPRSTTIALGVPELSSV